VRASERFRLQASFCLLRCTAKQVPYQTFPKTVLMVELLLHREMSTVRSNLPHGTDYRRVWTFPPRTLKLVIGRVPRKRVKCARKFRGQRLVRLRVVTINTQRPLRYERFPSPRTYHTKIMYSTVLITVPCSLRCRNTYGTVDLTAPCFVISNPLLVVNSDPLSITPTFKALNLTNLSPSTRYVSSLKVFNFSPWDCLVPSGLHRAEIWCLVLRS
jgi:hypothetical protein